MAFDDPPEDSNRSNRSTVAGSQMDSGMGARVTEPGHFMPNAAGGLSFIPRRGADSGMLTTRAALQRMAGDSPLQLLTYLADVHPSFGLAVWNLLRLGAPRDGLKIVAVQPGQNADASEQDDADTALIDALWASQPKHIGGFHGLQTTLLLSLALTGLPFLECVPGARNKGLRRLYTVDSLTLRFAYEQVKADDGGMDWLPIPYQLQRFTPETRGADRETGGSTEANSRKGGKSNWVRLHGERYIWRPLDSLPDDPNGRAPFAPALGEILRDLALMQDLTDAIHNAAWPRLGFPFNFSETYKIAKEVYSITDPLKAEEWVMKQFQASVRESNKLKSGQNVHFDSSGELITVEGAKGFAALNPILIYLRQRITQALKSLPTLLGINDGSTQTYTTVEWSIYAAGLETLRGIIAEILVEAANLHLRLLGRKTVAKAIYEKIRTTDALIEANTEAVRINNAARKRDEGWITNDQAAQEITGTDAVGPAPTVPLGDKSTTAMPAAGTTPEERKATRAGDRSAAQAEEKTGAESTDPEDTTDE